jgi:hypothetical protein
MLASMPPGELRTPVSFAAALQSHPPFLRASSSPGTSQLEALQKARSSMLASTPPGETRTPVSFAAALQSHPASPATPTPAARRFTILNPKRPSGTAAPASAAPAQPDNRPLLGAAVAAATKAAPPPKQMVATVTPVYGDKKVRYGLNRRHGK